MEDQLLLYEAAGYRCGVPVGEVLRIYDLPPGTPAADPTADGEPPQDLAALLHFAHRGRPAEATAGGEPQGDGTVLVLDTGHGPVSVRVDRITGIVSGKDITFLHVPGPLRAQTTSGLKGFYDVGDELVSRLDFHSLHAAA